MVFVLTTRKSCAHARRRHEGKIAEHVKRLSWCKIISEISFQTIEKYRLDAVLVIK